MAADQDIKSRPLYRPLRPDAQGRAHLLLCDGPGAPAAALDEPAAFDRVETWTLGGNGFADQGAMLAALRARLDGESVGLRLYAAGAEPFLWDVAAVARQAGMGAGEVFLCHAGTLRRRVQCVHCKTMLEGVTASLAACPGCGATLFVRDHFSARLSAFMGVRVDAEVPGELPEAEELYP